MLTPEQNGQCCRLSEADFEEAVARGIERWAIHHGYVGDGDPVEDAKDRLFIRDMRKRCEMVTNRVVATIAATIIVALSTLLALGAKVWLWS